MTICWKGLLMIKVHRVQWNEASKCIFGGSFSLLDPTPCPDFGSKSHSDGLEVKGNLRIRGVKGWTETTDMADLAARGRERGIGSWIRARMAGSLFVIRLTPTPAMIWGVATTRVWLCSCSISFIQRLYQMPTFANLQLDRGEKYFIH